jgi:ABC-2 type transport system permease protein
MSPGDSDLAAARQDTPPAAARRGHARFLRSEIGMVFRRRRNLALLGILALVPVLIAAAVKASGHDGAGGTILGGITDNGLFAALAGFLVVSPLFLPLMVSVVAGDTIAGEANSGTLRYLLTVPVGRTRLLAVKLTAIVVWCLVCVFVVALTGVLAGLALFPSGELTLLSGRTVAYSEGIGRLALVLLYVAATAVTVGAIGMFASTMTEVPIAAMAATLTLTIVSEVADAIPQLSAIHGWLPSHYWLQWIDLLRDPVDASDMVTGLLVTLGYVAFFASLAWARFGGKDITS